MKTLLIAAMLSGQVEWTFKEMTVTDPKTNQYVEVTLNDWGRVDYPDRNNLWLEMTELENGLEWLGENNEAIARWRGTVNVFEPTEYVFTPLNSAEAIQTSLPLSGILDPGQHLLFAQLGLSRWQTQIPYGGRLEFSSLVETPLDSPWTNQQLLIGAKSDPQEVLPWTRHEHTHQWTDDWSQEHSFTQYAEVTETETGVSFTGNNARETPYYLWHWNGTYTTEVATEWTYFSTDFITRIEIDDVKYAVSYEDLTVSGILAPGTYEIGASNGSYDAPLRAELTFSELLAGDVNGDKTVGFDDFLIIANSFGQSADYRGGDLDFSGTVDFPDFLQVAHNYGAGEVSAVAVPEPANWLLGSLAFLLILRRWS